MILHSIISYIRDFFLKHLLCSSDTLVSGEYYQDIAPLLHNELYINGCSEKKMIIFTSRTAQKLNLPSSLHRRRRSGDENAGPEEQALYLHGYAAMLHKSPPPAPSALLRRIGVKEVSGVGKVSATRIDFKRFVTDPYAAAVLLISRTFYF